MHVERLASTSSPPPDRNAALDDDGIDAGGRPVLVAAGVVPEHVGREAVQFHADLRTMFEADRWERGVEARGVEDVELGATAEVLRVLGGDDAESPTVKSMLPTEKSYMKVASMPSSSRFSALRELWSIMRYTDRRNRAVDGRRRSRRWRTRGSAARVQPLGQRVSRLLSPRLLTIAVGLGELTPPMNLLRKNVTCTGEPRQPLGREVEAEGPAASLLRHHVAEAAAELTAHGEITLADRAHIRGGRTGRVGILYHGAGHVHDIGIVRHRNIDGTGGTYAARCVQIAPAMGRRSQRAAERRMRLRSCRATRKLGVRSQLNAYLGFLVSPTSEYSS